MKITHGRNRARLHSFENRTERLRTPEVDLGATDVRDIAQELHTEAGSGHLQAQKTSRAHARTQLRSTREHDVSLGRARQNANCGTSSNVLSF